MVLRVCRSVLQDPHDAEDAFQVTFLALAQGRLDPETRFDRELAARDGASGGAEGADRGPAAAARESRVAEADVSRESPASSRIASVSPILHEEIERLPAKYRAPIVLCYLEGMTHDRAAGELGWPVGTVRGRLARARHRDGNGPRRRVCPLRLCPRWPLPGRPGRFQNELDEPV